MAGVVATMDLQVQKMMNPKVFVLVHPAWHGAWFWKKVVPRLREKGHRITLLDERQFWVLAQKR